MHKGIMKKRDGSSYKVMVAEDKEINQMMATHMFESLGCEVEVVKDGEQAVKKAIETAYDIIFMDCEMPIVDGYQATDTIRKHEETLPKHKHTPIIALTAKVMSGDKERCLSSGMDDYVSKPARIETIRDIIEKWCEHRIDHVKEW